MIDPDSEYVGELLETALCDQAGLAVVLRFYIDESGIHEQSPVVTVAAYSGRPKTWMAFTKEWNVKKRPIGVFHATDCAALRGEFEGWTTQDRDKLVANLLAILPKYELYGVAMGVNLKDLKAEIDARPDSDVYVPPPLVMALNWLFTEIVKRTEAQGINEALAFVAEDSDYKDYVTQTFEWVKNRRRRHTGPMTLTFAKKGEAVPLQAADVLAYEANKRLRDPSKPQRRSIAALDPNGEGRISVEGFAKPNIKNLVSLIEITTAEIQMLGRISKVFRPRSS